MLSLIYVSSFVSCFNLFAPFCFAYATFKTARNAYSQNIFSALKVQLSFSVFRILAHHALATARWHIARCLHDAIVGAIGRATGIRDRSRRRSHRVITPLEIEIPLPLVFAGYRYLAHQLHVTLVYIYSGHPSSILFVLFGHWALWNADNYNNCSEDIHAIHVSCHSLPIGEGVLSLVFASIFWDRR